MQPRGEMRYLNAASEQSTQAVASRLNHGNQALLADIHTVVMAGETL